MLHMIFPHAIVITLAIGCLIISEIISYAEHRKRKNNQPQDAVCAASPARLANCNPAQSHLRQAIALRDYAATRMERG